MAKLLSGGLLLRSLAENPRDKDRFAEFMHHAFEDDGDWRETSFTAWIEELLNTHPSMSLEQFWCVVDPAANGKIVSGLLLIPQIWRYEDIEIAVGRPEIVGTLPDYRRRGLVRELFSVLHEYSEARGNVVQAITGIPYFYRQFGYGLAVDLDSRGHVPFTAIPKLGDDETPKYHLRVATVADIPDLIEFDQADTQYALLSVVRDTTLWQYELEGRSPKSIWNLKHYIVEDKQRRAVGYVTINQTEHRPQAMFIWRWSIGNQANYLETYEDILRGLQTIATEIDDKIIAFNLSSSIHPTVIKLMKRMHGMAILDRTYAWYLRIPDHLAFIRKIAPVLERRLEGSPARKYTGKLRISFYQREDLLITFSNGKISDGCWTSEKGYPHARFPFQTWINVVFGANSESEIHSVLPDTVATAESAVLLEILFPKKKSSLFAIN